MKCLTIKLPFPPAILNPNARPHHLRLAAEKKKYRQWCRLECTAWGVNRFKADQIHLHIEFHPPNARRRDRDNLIAAFKAGQDALSDALGVDDSLFHVSYAPIQPPDAANLGYVIVRISDMPLVAEVPFEGWIK